MSKKTWLMLVVAVVVLTVGVFGWNQENHQVPIVSNETEVTVDKIQGACYVGGCSSQICSDTPEMASNCEYRVEYSCYQKTSTCKRQSNGECGWTPTNELKVCIANAVSAGRE